MRLTRSENRQNKKTGLPDVVLLFGGSETDSFAMKRLAVSGAIAFHVSASLFVFLIGHFVSLSQAFPDSASYQAQIVIAAEVFRQKSTMSAIARRDAAVSSDEASPVST